MPLHVRGVAAPRIVIQAWGGLSTSASVRIGCIFWSPAVMQHYGHGFNVAQLPKCSTCNSRRSQVL